MEHGFAVVVCKELLQRALQTVTVFITDECGWVLTTDNWYTSITLTTLLFKKYGWTLVEMNGTQDKGTYAGEV